MIQLIVRSIRIRLTRTRSSPTRRASFCRSSSSLFDGIEIKTMLSMPSTTSRSVKTPSAIYASGLVIHAMVGAAFAEEL